MVSIQIPEENELVLATIKKIMPYGAFCILPEYDNAEAFLHVSEVAPRWIKNIHEFISENQKVVVKVLRVDREKGQIDVSLRRVSEEEKRNKLEAVKRASRANKLLQFALTKSKSTMKLSELSAKLEEVFGEPYAALEAILERDDALKDIQIPEKLKNELVDIVRKSMKKAKVLVAAEITLRCFDPNGIEHIRKVLTVNEPDTFITYLGAPRYKLGVFAANYKEANKRMEKILKAMKATVDKDCIFEYKIKE